MKKLLYILTLLFTFSLNGYAQDDEGVVRERLVEYVQKKLDLSKAESERFTPVFTQYMKELRQTNQQYRGDRLVLQQKVVELRLRYRDQFKPIIGDKRSNEVFEHERTFVQEAKKNLQERMQNRKGGRSIHKTDTEL